MSEQAKQNDRMRPWWPADYGTCNGHDPRGVGAPGRLHSINGRWLCADCAIGEAYAR